MIKGKRHVKSIIDTVDPLGYVDENFEKPKFSRSILQFVQKSQYEWIGNLLPNRLVKCPRVGCDEVIFREDIDEKLVVCPKCKYAFCNDCRKSYHARFKLCLKINENDKYLGIPIEDLEAYPLLPQILMIKNNERKIWKEEN